MKGENSVTEWTKQFFNTVLPFFILFMSIWCQNNSPRSEISKTSSTQAVTIKHSHPAYQHASNLAERQALFNILLCHKLGQVTKFRFVQDLGNITKVWWHSDLPLSGKSLSLSALPIKEVQAPNKGLGFFPSANLSIHNFPGKIFSKLGRNKLAF